MKKIIVCLISILLFILFIVKVLDNYYSPKTEEYIYLNSKDLIQKSITKTISQGILKYIDSDMLINTSYNKNTNVSDVVINSKMVNEILLQTNEMLDMTFKKETEYLLEIPIGTLISKNLFSGIGKKIKIPIVQSNTYISDIKTNTEEFGINSTKVEIYLNIKFDCLALIPFNHKTMNIDYNFLIGSFIIMGQVPNYYYASSDDKSFPYIPN